jgi:hypothetical protein
VATLGSESDAQRIDSIRKDDVTDSSDDEEVAGLERFYLQYFFPPSSVGECGRVGPAGGAGLVTSIGRVQQCCDKCVFMFLDVSICVCYMSCDKVACYVVWVS